MALQTNLPSYTQALDMVDKPNTSFKYLKYKKHISLSPKYISTELTGIKEILNTELAVYSDVLDGIPIAFNKPKCVQKYGSIMDENPYMHFDVEVECVMFQPKKGNILIGIVNKLAEDHIGCLVHGKFNASLHKSTGTSSGDKEWVGNILNGGDEIEFEVLGLNTRGVVSMYGKFTEKCAHKIRKQHRKSLKRKSNSLGSVLPSLHARGDCVMNENSVSDTDIQKDMCKKTKNNNDETISNESGFTSLLDKDIGSKLKSLKDEVSPIKKDLESSVNKSENTIETHNRKGHKKTKKLKKERKMKEDIIHVNGDVKNIEPSLKKQVKSELSGKHLDRDRTVCNEVNSNESTITKHHKKLKIEALESDISDTSALSLSADYTIKKRRKIKKEKKD